MRLLYKMNQELIFFNSRDQLLRIGIDDIVYFEADGNLTNIVTANKLKGTVNMNLGKMEQFLLLNFTQRASTFLRVGKRFIINMSHIYLINVPKQKLVLSDYRTFTFQLPVSKDALRKVKELVLINKM